MLNKKIKIAIITNIIPSYRKGFYDNLFANEKMAISIYCQDHIEGASFNTIHQLYPNNIHIVKFYSIPVEKLVWQNLPWREIYSNYDIVFVDGNPRIVTHALLATFLRLFQKKVIVWSMVHSYKNNKITEKIRLLWLRLFKYHFVYNDADVKTLEGMGFKNKTILAMNNGLDQKIIDDIKKKWDSAKLNEWIVQKQISNRKIIISSGRLTANKYDLLLDALPHLVTQFPDILWCVIGDGVDRKRMENISKERGLTPYIKFIGALFDEEALAPWFLSAQLFIHPYAVGLSIMHAFGYGLPIITHDKKELHGPEYIAFEPERTGLNYEDGNAQHLAEVIAQLLNDDSMRLTMKKYSQELVREKYNVDVMAERFFQIVGRM